MKKILCPECGSENISKSGDKYKCSKCGYYGSYVKQKFVYGE